MIHRFLPILCIVCIVVSSCKDDDNEKGPDLDFLHPVIHEHYMNGEAIPWQGVVTDNRAVTHIALRMWAEEDSSHLVFQADYFPDAQSVAIDTQFTVDETEVTEFHFRILAEDADGNVTRNDADDHVHINE